VFKQRQRTRGREEGLVLMVRGEREREGKDRAQRRDKIDRTNKQNLKMDDY